MQMVQGQDWNRLPGGNVINTTEWLGADFGSTIPLSIETRADQPIDFSTSNQFRARINEKISYASLNSFQNIDASGFMLVTPDDGFLGQVPKGPFSRLHLAEGGPTGNAQQWGYRPWQRNGITFTGNHDQGYMGQKYGEEVRWSTQLGQVQTKCKCCCWC